MGEIRDIFQKAFDLKDILEGLGEGIVFNVDGGDKDFDEFTISVKLS